MEADRQEAVQKIVRTIRSAIRRATVEDREIDRHRFQEIDRHRFLETAAQILVEADVVNLRVIILRRPSAICASRRDIAGLTARGRLRKKEHARRDCLNPSTTVYHGYCFRCGEKGHPSLQCKAGGNNSGGNGGNSGNGGRKWEGARTDGARRTNA